MMTRTVLLTGASGKFGRVFLDYLLANGHTVIGTASSRASLDEIFVAYGLCEKSFHGIVMDLCEDKACQRLMDILKEKNLYPDCLINNARSLRFLESSLSGMISRENFLNEYLLDVIVPYELSMELRAHSEELNLILNIGSQYGSVAANPTLYKDYKRESPIHYGVAKAALSHLTKELAVRFADDGIQVNCIAYGGVEGRVDEQFKKRYSKI